MRPTKHELAQLELRTEIPCPLCGRGLSMGQGRACVFHTWSAKEAHEECDRLNREESEWQELNREVEVAS